MSRSVNKVILLGYLGADPERRYTPANVPVATMSLATNQSWTDQSGTRQESTEWHRLVAWRKLADICYEHLRKGTQIYVEGRLRTRIWEDSSGVRRYTTEVVIEELVMLGGTGTGGNRPPAFGDNDTPPAGRGEDEYSTGTPGEDLPF